MGIAKNPHPHRSTSKGAVDTIMWEGWNEGCSSTSTFSTMSSTWSPRTYNFHLCVSRLSGNATDNVASDAGTSVCSFPITNILPRTGGEAEFEVEATVDAVVEGGGSLLGTFSHVGADDG